MTFDTWPLELLWPGSMQWRLSGGAMGSTGASGLWRGNSVLGGGFWVCEMFVPLESVQVIKAVNALVTHSDGGNTPLIVPRYAEAEAPYLLGEPLPDVPHSDDTPFSDDTLYSSGGINVTLAEDADLRATRITLDLETAAPLVGGEHFSIDYPVKGKRMHMVTRVYEDGEVAIRPPIYEDVPAGTVVDFNTPATVMRIMNYEDCLSPIAPPYRSSLTIRFQEAICDAEGNY